MSPYRRLNGTSDFLRQLPGNGGVQFGTFAAIVNLTANTEPNIITQQTSGAAGQLDLWVQSGKLAFYNGAAVLPSSIEIGTAEGWLFVGWTKATGSAKPKFYKYKFSTGAWTIVEGSTAMANGATIVGGKIDLGKFGSSEFMKGDYAIGGIWGETLSEATMKSLAEVTYLNAWRGIGTPKAIWTLHQSAVAEEVGDLTGGGSTQNERSGTEVILAEPPIPYNPPLAMVI